MKAAVITALALGISGLCQAQGPATCDGLVAQYRQALLGGAPDVEVHAELVKGFALLQGCKDRYCVIVADMRGPAPWPTRLVSGDRVQDLPDGQGAYAILAVGRFHNARHGMACMIAEYSGGSAAAWDYQGQSLDGRYMTVDGSEPSLDGDAFDPAPIIEAMDDTQKRVAWQRVRRKK